MMELPESYTLSKQVNKHLRGKCMKCGTLIQRAAYMGGTGYYCEKCQKK